MASNFISIFLQKYGDLYTIKQVDTPTYLRAILGPSECNDDKIIYIYIEDRNINKHIEHMSPLETEVVTNDSIDNLDLTGSPLKDDFSVEGISDISLNIKHAIINNPWKLEEEYHTGLCVHKVRSIICSQEFQNVFHNKLELNSSIWFLCSAKDRQKTLFLQYKHHADDFYRGIIYYMGVIRPNDINMTSLLKNHYNVISKDCDVEIRIENVYSIRNTMICCSWTTTSNTSLINLNTCDIILKQMFSINDSTSLTKDFIIELRNLMIIRDNILSYKESEKLEMSKEPVYNCGTGIELSKVRESINEVFEITGIIEPATLIDIEDNNIESVTQKAKHRRLTDLTDKLWDILKCCSSYKDLKQSFNILFQCAVRYNIVNTPFTNKNRLAEIITEVANRRLAIPILSGSEPLEFLLEIGLEKLYKDYEFIFVESQICAANDFKQLNINYERRRENDARTTLNVRKSLRNALPRSESINLRKTLLQRENEMEINEDSDDSLCFQNIKFNESETGKAVANLYKIHCILEHILMLHINFKIPSVYRDIFYLLLNKPADMIFNLNNTTLSNKLEIALLPHQVRERLKHKEPVIRHITIKSRTKHRQVSTIFYYNVENMCPPQISESLCKMEEQEVTKEQIYYYWLYRKIITIGKM